jgi:hypothetical protein
VQEPVKTTLSNVNFGLVVCLAYVIFKSHKLQTLRSNLPFTWIIVFTSLWGIIQTVVYLNSYENTTLVRIHEFPVLLSFSDALWLSITIYVYVNGIGFVLIPLLAVLLAWYLQARRLRNAKGYTYLIQFTSSYILFRAPTLLASIFFPFNNTGSLWTFVIESFHGVVDAVIICRLV